MKKILYIFLLLVFSNKVSSNELGIYIDNQNLIFEYEIDLDSNIVCNNIKLNNVDLKLKNDTSTVSINKDIEPVKLIHFPYSISIYGENENKIIVINSSCDGNSCPEKTRIYNSKGEFLYYNFSSKYVAIEEVGDLNSILEKNNINRDEFFSNSNMYWIEDLIYERK